MQRTIVGGPLLGTVTTTAEVHNSNTTTAVHNDRLDDDRDTARTMAPVAIQSWLLLPTETCIAVLECSTGRRVASLVVQQDIRTSNNNDNNKLDDAMVDLDDPDDYDANKKKNENGSKTIEDDRVNPIACEARQFRRICSVGASSSSLSSAQSDAASAVVWVGCSDGTVHVFVLDDGVQYNYTNSTENTAIWSTRAWTKPTTTKQMDSVRSVKPCHVYQIAAAKKHYAVSYLSAVVAVGLPGVASVYALLTKPTRPKTPKTDTSASAAANVLLVKVLLPLPGSQYPSGALLATRPKAQTTTTETFESSQIVPIENAMDRVVLLDSFHCCDHTAILLPPAAPVDRPPKQKKQKPPSTSSSHPFYLEAVRLPQPDSNERHSRVGKGGSVDAVVVLVATAESLTLYCDTAANAVHAHKDRAIEDEDVSNKNENDKAGASAVAAKVILDSAYWTEPLTACHVHAESGDIACGHESGSIRVVCHAIPIIAKYMVSHREKEYNKKQEGHHHGGIASKKLRRRLILRRVHWHAHAVGSLSYNANTGALYSGGDESVLLSWLLQQHHLVSSDKPAHMLPRISAGKIRHVLHISGGHTHSSVGAAPDAVLVACSDNSLQLLEAESKSLLWKYHGLASDAKHSQSNVIAMSVDRRHSDTIVLSGLPNAPGSIHWYNTLTQRVVHQWEVVPFNRVSRTERRRHRSRNDTKVSDSATHKMPTPEITHSVFAGDNSVAVTVDVVPTENSSVGAPVKISSNPSAIVFGSVTTIRFWDCHFKANDANIHLECAAVMTAPHGSRNRIDAIAVMHDGSVVATISNDEVAIRLWYRGTVDNGNEPDGRGTTGTSRDMNSQQSFPSPQKDDWMCRCKVSFPSGYSNFPSTSLAFSSDASVLAATFGPFVTLWDLDSIALLSALRHDDDTNVLSMSFIPTSDRVSDGMMLLHSETCVSLRSPYGNRSLTTGWNWMLPANEVKRKSSRISQVHFIINEAIVVIAQYNCKTDRSRLVLVDAATGALFRNLRDGASPILDNINGEVASLASSCRRERASGNILAQETNTLALVTVLALTSTGEMIRFSNRKEEPQIRNPVVQDNSSAIPTLPLLGGSDMKDLRKRTLDVLEIEDLERGTQRKFTLKQFGGINDGALIPSSQLPLLRGAFVRGFVMRNLQRHDSEQ